MPASLASRSIVVIGLMGSGKSAVASRLAARLGRVLRDSDADIEAATGRTVRELATSEGVTAMHDREAAHLLDALAEHDPVVVAAAGSTIERADCRQALGRAAVVWLDVVPTVLAARFASRPHRPDFGRPVAALLAEQQERRGPLYASVADIVLRDSAATPDALADAVLDAIEA